MEIRLVDDADISLDDSIRRKKGRETVIKVVGVGGCGGNAINRMIKAGIASVDYIAMNTDVQALKQSHAKSKLALGEKVTRGLGAGGDPKVGRRAAEESRDEIIELLQGADMVFVTAGMGGGTGTGGAPMVARIAKELGALTVGFVTMPFDYERKHRQTLAQEGVAQLRQYVDSLIKIPNQSIFEALNKNTKIDDAMGAVDDVLHQGVKGITEIITVPGEINIDFADVKTVMSMEGDAIMGVGRDASRDAAARNAAMSAMHTPFLKNRSLKGARGLLVNIRYGENGTINDFHEIMALINKDVHEDAEVFFGFGPCDSFKPNEIQVTIIAAGFDSTGNGEDFFDSRDRRMQETPRRTTPQDPEYIEVPRWQSLINDRRSRSRDDDFDIPSVIRTHKS